MNKNSKKALLIGLTATAAVAAVAAMIAYEEDTVDRIGSFVNRQRLKMYVKHNLTDNNKVMKAVDSLSDKEIDTLLGLLEKTSDWKDSASDFFSDLKDKAADAVDAVEDKIK